MLLRTATAAVGLAVLLGALWGGLPWVFLLTCLAAGLGIREFYRLYPPVLRWFQGEGAAKGEEAVSEGALAGPSSACAPVEPTSALISAHGEPVEPCPPVLRQAQDERTQADNAQEERTQSENPPDERPPWDNTPGQAQATPLPVLVGIVWAVAFVIGGAGANGLFHFWAISAGVFIVGAFVSLLWLIAFYHGTRWSVAVAYLVGGPVYVGFLLGHVMALAQVGENFFLAYPLEFDIRQLPDNIYELGRNWLLFALLTTFATDTGAYLVGRTVGRHPMAPKISPNKTWEGALGGFLGAVLAAALLERALNLGLGNPGWESGWDSAWNWQPLLIGATVGIASQAGDLLESWLKRRSQVKDAGSLMPGHGGILDRLDSLLITVPVVYYLLLAVLRL